MSQDLGGFWKAQKQIVSDIWVVLHGDERRAVRMALWIALIDQAMGSTAVVNYAPQVVKPPRLTLSLRAPPRTVHVLAGPHIS